MKLALRFKGMERSSTVVAHVRRRVGFALARLATQIRAIVIRFEDVNGPKDGLDKRCRVEVTGRFGSCSIETRDADVYIAADRALELCEEILDRRRGRRTRVERPDSAIGAMLGTPSRASGAWT